MNERKRAELALVFNTLVWGSTFVVVKEALTGITPLLFLAARFTLATLALLAFNKGTDAFSRGKMPPSPVRDDGKVGLSPYRGGLVCGVLLFAGFAFQTFGLRLTTAPKSAFITGLSVALVPFFAALVYRVRPHVVEIAGVALAVTGLALMTLHGSSWTISRGDLLTVGCAVAFAGHIIALGHYSAGVNFQLLCVIQVGAAALLSLATFWWAEPPAFELRPSVWIAVLITGLLATALALALQTWAQQHTTATRTALIFMLEPVFAWVTSWLLAGESLSPRGVAGAGLILGGVLLVELKPSVRPQHPGG